MRIKTFGAKHFTGQLPRICEGFKELGHEVIEDGCADLVYVNDPGGFDQAIEYIGPRSKIPWIIFNIQDIPHHLFPNFDLKKLDRQLKIANVVTAISRTTQKDVLHFLDIYSFIIYQPIMPIFEIKHFEMKTNMHHNYKYLIVGRNSDPNKRNLLAWDYLKKYDPHAKVAVVGSEYCGFGDYLGVVSNDVLNELYNSVEYIFSLTKYGGIELSQVEAIMAGKFPIVCTDSDVSFEFNLEFMASPNAEGIHQKILEIEQNQIKYKEIVKEKQKDFKQKFDKVEVARKILNLAK